MQWSSAHRLILAAALASVSLQGRAAEPLNLSDVVARELSAVVSISSLRPPRPATGATVAATSAAGKPAASTNDADQTTAGAAPGNLFAAPSAGPRSPRAAHVLGTGFIIDTSGIIVTNRHVIEGTTNILVTLQDDTLLRATLLAKADQIDVALLKVTPASPLPVVRFGDSDAVRIADTVLAIGNPLGLGGSVTQGIVSALNRDILDSPFDDYIQTDAAINHGNSGGPLFNMKGDVIGMNTAIFAPSASGSIGLGFAIPSKDIKFVADAIRSPGGMHVGTLDFRIQQITPGIADALNMPKAEGAIVSGMKDGGGAAECGIVAGDIIMRYGTMPVKDVRALARAIARTVPGTVVNLRVLHDEEPTVIAATIKELPQVAPQTIDLPTPAVGPVNPGWKLAPIDSAERHLVGLDSNLTGVVVKQVTPDGTAADAGLNPGDVVVEVQLEKVGTPEDVARLIALAWQKQRRFVALLVHNADGLRWLAMSLD